MVTTMRATAVFEVTHGQYMVQDDGVPLPAAIEGDGIVFPGEEPALGAVILTGTFYGPVEVTVDVLDTPPPPAEPDGWERVEETTLTAAGDLIGVYPLMDEAPEGLPELAVKPGDSYSVRVSIRGFQAGAEREQYPTGEPPVEEHLVQLWPT
ncbi:hypothetical protein BJF78_24710 [Pseudonocardia sp. CNS-139]|nr:hypothetical protein BJF78_24710 [Pseudonocardia sp. CNS-139]